MTITDRNIIKAYTGLLEGLNTNSKIELIENLSKTLMEDANIKEKSFYKSFGAFESDKSAEEIISEIKLSRRFRNKEIDL